MVGYFDEYAGGTIPKAKFGMPLDATYGPIVSEKVVKSANTFSSSTRRRAPTASVDGSKRVSATTIWYFFPFTPPLALASRRNALTASTSASPRNAAYPERGARTPTLTVLSVTPCEAGPGTLMEPEGL